MGAGNAEREALNSLPDKIPDILARRGIALEENGYSRREEDDGSQE